MKWVKNTDKWWRCTSNGCNESAVMRSTPGQGHCQFHWDEMLSKQKPGLLMCTNGRCGGTIGVKFYDIKPKGEELVWKEYNVPRCQACVDRSEIILYTPVVAPEVMLAEQKPKLVCEQAFAQKHYCAGEVKYYSVRGHGGETWERCLCGAEVMHRRQVHPELTYALIEPEPKEDVTKPNCIQNVPVLENVYPPADPNAAMIKRDIKVPTSWAELYRGISSACSVPDDSQNIARAWNRTNRIPRIVGFDPHLPRGE